MRKLILLSLLLLASVVVLANDGSGCTFKCAPGVCCKP